MTRSGLTAGMTNAEAHRTLRADAVRRGLCIECRRRFPKIGNKVCAVCIDAKRQRRKANLARRLCLCGKALDGRYRNCVACRRMAAARVAIRRRRLADSGTCCRCERLPRAPGHARCLGCMDSLADLAQQQYTASKVRTRAPVTCSICGGANHNSRRHMRGRGAP